MILLPITVAFLFSLLVAIIFIKDLMNEVNDLHTELHRRSKEYESDREKMQDQIRDMIKKMNSFTPVSGEVCTDICRR